MIKKVISFTLSLIFIISIIPGCSNKHSSYLQITNEDMNALLDDGITEYEYAAKVFLAPITILSIIAEFDTYDGMIAKAPQLLDTTATIAYDKEQIPLTGYSKHWQIFFDAIFNPKIYLDKQIKGPYKIKRIFCLDSSVNDRTPEQSIYYETNKGVFILFYTPGYDDALYLIPYNVARAKVDECIEEINMGVIFGNFFWDIGRHFPEYKLE